jgi:hypothetical protein
MSEPVPMIEQDDSYDRRRIVANAKRVARERRVRWTLRVIIVVGMALFLGWVFMGESLPEWFGAVALLGVLASMLAAGALFMMGGLAPSSVRRKLTEKQRRQLDD